MGGSIESLVNREYQYGFVTDIDAETIRAASTRAPSGSFAAESERSGSSTGRLKAYARWTTMQEPHWSNVKYARSTTRTSSTSRRPSRGKTLGSLESGRPQAPRDVRQARHLGRRAEAPQQRRGGVVMDSVSVGTSFKTELSKLGIIFCSARPCARAFPSSCRMSGVGRSHSDNFFAALDSAGIQRRLVRLRAQGGALPDGAVDVLPRFNAEGHGQFERTLIIADGGRVRELPRRVHGSQARHEPAARTSRCIAARSSSAIPICTRRASSASTTCSFARRCCSIRTASSASA